MTLVPDAVQSIAETLADIRRAQGRHIARINEHMHTLNFFSIELGNVTSGVGDLNTAATDLVNAVQDRTNSDTVDLGRNLRALRMDVGEFTADVTSLRNILGDLQTSTAELRSEMISFKQTIDLLTPYLHP
ncbi:MAG TPA: hypothetical protein VFC19_12705 [Candidatus Limnocylindrales bacterium]|nr:hypothetical protein [Candidatus Limnocylindrales bacterium]